MTKLLLCLINRSIAAGWLILVVLLARVMLQKAPKWVNVLLWGIVAVRLLCPFSMESELSLIPQIQAIPDRLLSILEPDAMSERRAGSTGTTPTNDWQTDFLADGQIGTTSDGTGMSAGKKAADEQANREAESQGLGLKGLDAAEKKARAIGNTLVAVWLAGAILLFAFLEFRYWRLYRLVATAVRLQDNIFQSEYIRTPFILGVRKPKIYIPFGMDSQNMQYVILHEKAHIRRGDHCLKLVGALLLSIYWFHPLVWLAYALLCRDIELACDEKVIRHLDRAGRADYSQALLACSTAHKTVVAYPLAFGELGIKERVTSVLSYKKPACWGVAAAILVCIGVAICFLTDPTQSDAAEKNMVNTDEKINTEALDILVWEEADLDRDGETEQIRVREIEKEVLYELDVIKKDGSVLWSVEVGTAHTGWNTIVFYQSDGADYLLQYQPTMYQGIGSYTCTMLSLEGGREVVENEWSTEFTLPVRQLTWKMRGFAEQVNVMLKNGTVLLSAGEEGCVIGPKPGTEVGQVYPVIFESKEASFEKISSEENSSKEKQDTTKGYRDSLPFEEPSLTFWLASGAGGWRTELTLYQDGRFEGVYEDGEASFGEDYPNGSAYFCSFHGQFDQIEAIGSYAYRMQLKELVYETEVGEVWIEEGIRYIGSEAYGIKDGEEFIFYLPDILPQELEEPFLEWWPDWNLWKNGSIQTLLSYGIWNVTTGEGFFSSWIEESDIMP